MICSLVFRRLGATWLFTSDKHAASCEASGEALAGVVVNGNTRKGEENWPKLYTY